MRLRFLAALTAALLLALGGPSGGAKNAGAQTSARGGSTEGQLLIAAPHMPDPRFAQTVIYMVSHNAQGAFGLVINRPIGAGPMREFLMGFGLEGSGNAGDVLLHYGGPVEPARLFVLHSSDWTSSTTMTIHGEIAVTAHPEVLEAIAEGRGPRHSLVILGYAGWGPQQLDQELAREDWITAPADPALVFDGDAESKWERASEIGGLAL